MQAQFEEYRGLSEFIYNSEIAKIDDEIAFQSSKYEQEMMFVIQSKDKFYFDMMVAKDAKIMGFIDGSDLQGIIQKHELVI